MGERFIVDIEAGKKSHLDGVLSGLNGAVNKVAENISPPDTSVAEQLAILNQTISAGFAAVVAEIAKLQPPAPPPARMRGTIMSDYQVPDDQADGRVTFNLSVTDSENQPITDPAVLAGLGFEAVSSDENAFTVTLDADQPDPTKRVGGYHVGAPGQAAITSNLKDADGNLLATGTDGFTVTTGKVSLGAVSSEFEGLTPIS